MAAGIKVYRVSVEGYVQVTDFKDNEDNNPNEWNLEHVIEQWEANRIFTIQSTLVDTIEWV
jgi:hypothetical protein